VNRERKDWVGYGFVLPYLTLFGLFLLLPLGYGLYLSFTDYELVSPDAVAHRPPKFAGLANYNEAMHDADFWKALGATAKFVVMASPLTILIALILALGISTVAERRQHLYRLAFFVPTMITISVAGLVWRWFYSAEFGLFNAILGHWGIKVPWISDASWAMRSVVLMTLWWAMGGPIVVLLAGIKQIPDVYYEAAAIDGATGWRSTFYITLPLLKPVLLFVMVINIIGAFQVFGQTFMITSGGPARATHVLVQYIYTTAFQNYRLGYGAAMSWLLFVVISIFSIIQFRLMREK
jgi:multiple sugar transport system permease protein